MVVGFLGSSALLCVFATGLHHHLAADGSPPWSTCLLGVAGLALALLAFKADPAYLPTP